MQKTFSATAFLDALDHFIPLFPECVHFYQCFRRVLEVAVHNSDHISGCLRHSCKNCRFFPEISGKTYTENCRVFVTRLKDLFPGIVAGTVIYQNQFVRNSCSFQYFPKNPAGFSYYKSLIISRKHN